jgi:hypothetical protein
MGRLLRAALLGVACSVVAIAVLAALVSRPTAGGNLDLARSSRAGVRVLFVGNSLTFKNDLPELVHRLGGERTPIFAGSFTAPGWRLRQFAGNHHLDRLLHEIRWDVVVLQEQSQIPSFSQDERADEFTPYVKELADEIRANGAEPLLFVTWARRTGDRRNVSGDTYAAMQQRVVDGYWDAAHASASAVAPVGVVWANALSRRPQLELWASDGTHPSRAGSYLAACVFYRLLTRKSPVGNAYTAGLQPSLARFLQRASVTG